MNVKDPVSSIMTKELITVSPETNLLEVKQLFSKNSIHHIPVVHFRKIVGLISKSDFLLYANSLGDSHNLEVKEDQKLKFTKVKQIMVTRLGKMQPEDRIEVAIDIFLSNYFHCIPIVQGDDLMGILTPYDILKGLN